jgi:hypothetical protein
VFIDIRTNIENVKLNGPTLYDSWKMLHIKYLVTPKTAVLSDHPSFVKGRLLSQVPHSQSIGKHKAWKTPVTGDEILCIKLV